MASTTKLETVVSAQTGDCETDEIEAVDCTCENCITSKTQSTTELSVDLIKDSVKFPKINYENPKENEPPVSFAGLAKCFGTDLSDSTDPNEINLKNVDFPSIVRIFTYLSADGDEEMKQLLPELIKICDLLLLVDLDKQIQDVQMRQDFIRKACMLFVMCWHGKMNGLNGAEWYCFQSRRFMSHIMTFKSLANEAKHVIFKEEFWPDIGPVAIIEGLCKEYLYCGETLSFLCNLTRNQGMPEELNGKSKCISIIKEKFYGYCRNIDSNASGLGGLLMHLLVNLSRVSGFSEFMITANHAYFMHPVLLNVLTSPETSGAVAKAVWPFLKNLTMTDAGRNALLENLSVFLGPILYPIAGPEEIDEKETKKLPPEVQYLPETKTRAESRRIRECILDILLTLCRFRRDREKLRDFNVYQVLKHYHLWEEDEELQETLENLVNILIREEGTEIPVDDLMEGLTISDKNGPA